ncbi:dehydrase and lipid transport-domain-containing protein [Podospora aff. communis PSN243]|uniref:Dehydrase and lipid transport-domain-containing protein n=1 Tax=Podospora aff. communis PSN243 TaxID=3040156 RepID=A0AAV9H7A6_9PEZI|nr:dehydrase and lipid transport-domain-containing protein [Podospora aff. communis PSN243]
MAPATATTRLCALPSRALRSSISPLPLTPLLPHLQQKQHPPLLLRRPKPQQPPLLHPTPSTHRLISTLLRTLLPSSPSTLTKTPPQTLHTQRTLPHTPSQLYTIIADIDSYRFFLPNCTASTITHWTRPGPSSHHKPLPTQADLTVGWGPFTQSYTSRVYCVPGSIVEAVSGNAETGVEKDVLRGLGYDVDSAGVGDGVREGVEEKGIFESLVTRWTVREAKAPAGNGAGSGQEWAEVELKVQFRFADPTLGFAVGQVADQMAVRMVEAFEERARRLYGKKNKME